MGNWILRTHEPIEYDTIFNGIFYTNTPLSWKDVPRMEPIHKGVMFFRFIGNNQTFQEQKISYNEDVNVHLHQYCDLPDPIFIVILDDNIYASFASKAEARRFLTMKAFL